MRSVAGSVRVGSVLVGTGEVPLPAEERLTVATGVLHPWEVEQSRLLADGEARSRYVHVHVAVHLWVAQVLGLPQGAFTIERRPCLRCDRDHGAPVVVAQGRRWYLSTSRTGRCYAVALSRSEVGVDVETVRRTLDLESVVRVACGEAERAHLSTLPRERAHATFFRWWTAKEAVTKATGHGLQADFRSVRERPGGPAGVWEHAGRAWQVDDLAVAVPGVLGAVASPWEG